MRHTGCHLLAWLIVVVIVTPASAQLNQSETGERPWLSIGGAEGDLLTIPATINGKPARALIDTGTAGVILDRSFALKEGLPLTHIGTGRDLGGAQERYTTPQIQMSVDGIKGPDAPAQVADLTNLKKASGFSFDVVIGASFIAAYGLEIDFDDRRLRFQAPDKPAKVVDVVTLAYDGREFIIKAKSIDEVIYPLFIDLGHDGGARIGRTAIDKLAGGHKVITDIEYIGAGGSEINGLTSLPEFKIGTASFGTVDAIIVRNDKVEDRPNMTGSLGLAVLAKYNMIIDVKGGRLIFLMRSKKIIPGPKTTVGIQGVYDPTRIVVTHVMKGSPAERAGLKDNDSICSVNDVPVVDGWRGSPMRHWGTVKPGVPYKIRMCSGVVRNIVTSNFY